MHEQQLMTDLKVPVLSRIALFSSTTTNFSKILAAFLFLLSQFQILIVLLRPVLLSYQQNNITLPWVYSNIFQAINPQDYIQFNESSSMTLMILEIILIYGILYVILICYVGFVLYEGKTLSDMGQKLWNFTSLLHSNVIFYLIHVICMGVIDHLSNGDKLILSGRPQPSSAFQTLAVVVSILNFVWTLLLITLFETNIKTKNTLSAKTSFMSLLDLGFKVVMPILWTIVDNSEKFDIWMMAFGLIYCLIKGMMFFYYLPYYRLYVLKLSSISIAISVSLAMAALLAKIIGNTRSYNEYSLLVFMWILLGIFCIGLYSNRLESRLKRILQHPMRIRNPYHLIHYINIYKAYSAYTASGLSASMVKEKYLHYVATVKQSKVANMLCSDANQAWSSKTQAEINRHFYNFYLELLSKSILKNPKMKLLKITLARFYAKKEEFCVQADNTLTDGLRHWYSYKNAYYHIKLIIANKLKYGRQKQADSPEEKVRGHLDLQTFVQLSTEFRIIKKEIIGQIKLQTQFWKEFQSSKPDFLDLVGHARKIHSKSRMINRTIALYRDRTRISCIESLLVSGLYYYFVQNDIARGQKLIRDYFNIKTRRAQTEVEATDSDDLSLKSIYFVISASSKKLGIITDCSGRAKKVFGIPKELLIGKSFITLMPPIYAKSCDSILNTSYSGVKSDILDKPMDIALFSKNGHLVQTKMQMTLSYLPGYGLCFYALMKPIQDNKRIVLTSTYGGILNFSREFGEDMNLLQNEEKVQWDIHDLCPGIERVLQEFGRTPIKYGDIRTKFFVNNMGSASSPKRFATMSTSLKELDTDTKLAEKGGEPLESPNKSAVTGVNLVFYPPESKKGLEKRTFSRQLTREGINYRVDFKELVAEGTRVFELRLEKSAANDLESSGPKRLLKRNFAGTLALKIRKQDNEQNNVSVESPQAEAEAYTYNLLTPKSIQPLISPGLTSQRMTMIGTLQTNEEDESNSPSFFKKKRKTDTTTTNNPMDTNADFVRFELPPPDTLISQVRWVRGDEPPHINEEEEDYGDDDDGDFEEKGLSEILQSNSIDNKVHNGSPVHHEQNFELDKNAFKANFREASSTQDTPFTRENNRVARAHKMIRKIISSKKHSFATLYYNLSFIVTMAILMSFLVWLNFHTSSTSHTVESLGTVIHNAYFRNYWTKVMNQDTLLVLVFGDDNAVQAGTTSYNSMIQANAALEVSVAGLDLTFQSMFYEKNIRVHKMDENGVQHLIAIEDSFQTTKMIYNTGLPTILHRVELDPADYITDIRTRFVLDNSSNDLLIVSENLLALLKDTLFGVLTSSRNAMVAFLAVTMIIQALFILSSLRFARLLNTESNNCMEMLFTIQPHQIANIELSLNTFKDLLELDSEETEFLGLLNLKSQSGQNDKENNGANSHGNTKNNRKVVRKTSMKKVYNRNYFTFGGLFLCLGLIVTFTLIYYNQAVDKLTVMKKQQENSNAALDYLNIIALISIGMQQLLLVNSTTTIRNQDDLTVFMETAALVKQFTDLQDSLKNEKGEFSPGQEEILFAFNCTNAFSPYYSWDYEVMQPECETLSDGLNVVGLVQILAKLDVAVSQWIITYEGLSKDVDTLFDDFMLDYVTFGNIATMTDISIVILGHSYMASTTDFASSVKTTENERIVLTWVAIIVTILLGSLTYILVVRRLSNSEFEKKDLLALVPNRLIFESLLLKRYIVKISRGESKEAKRLLGVK